VDQQCQGEQESEQCDQRRADQKPTPLLLPPSRQKVVCHW
jgi:hypothetical protein